MTDLAFEAFAADDWGYLEAVVLAGLQRRVWNGRRDDAAAFALAGGAARVFEALCELAPTQAPGPYVCEGDERGRGCGLVFTATRASKCCPLCHASRIVDARFERRPYFARGVAVGELPADLAVWADSFDPGCRKLKIYRACDHCREPFEATRADQRYHSKACKTAAWRASRSEAA